MVREGGIAPPTLAYETNVLLLHYTLLETSCKTN